VAATAGWSQRLHGASERRLVPPFSGLEQLSCRRLERLYGLIELSLVAPNGRGRARSLTRGALRPHVREHLAEAIQSPGVVHGVRGLAGVTDRSDLAIVIPDRLHETFAIRDDRRLVLGSNIGRSRQDHAGCENQSGYELDGQTSQGFLPVVDGGFVGRRPVLR